MHSSCKNLLTCIDILSVALVVGLAIEDGPSRKSRNSREDEVSETSECQETIEELQDGDEKKKTEDEKEKAKVDHKVVTQTGSSSNANADPRPISPLPVARPERDKNVEEITEFIDSRAQDGSCSSCSSEFPEIALRKDNLKRKLMSGKTIQHREESDGNSSGQNHPIAPKRARNYTTDSSDSSVSPKTSANNSRTFHSNSKYPTRAYHYPEPQGPSQTLGRTPTRRDSSTDDDESVNAETDQVSESDSEEDRYRRPKNGTGTSIKDQGVSEAECVQHVQDSLDQVPKVAITKTKELHSNSGRELETAAAVRDRLKKQEQDNAVKDQGVSEAEFVQHVQESLEKAPGFFGYAKEGLHSNSGRELESAAAIKHATTSRENGSSVPEPPKFDKQGLHSNTVRELVGAAVLVESQTSHHSNRPRATSPTGNSSIPQKAKLEKRGLHSNTVRELVGAAVLADSQASPDSDGPRTQRPGESSNSSGSKTRSNAEGPLKAAEANKEKFNKDHESEGTSKKIPRRLSQRSLIGNSVAAALHMPAQSVENYAESRKETTSHPKSKRKLSTRSLVGLSYEKRMTESSGPKGTSGSNGGRAQEGNQKRKLSQNDLISLGHLALRDTWDVNNAGPSSCSRSNEVSVEGASQSVSFPSESHSSLDQKSSEPESNRDSSTVAKTSRERINFQAQTSTSSSSDCDNQQQPPMTHRDFQNFHPYHQDERDHAAAQLLGSSSKEKAENPIMTASEIPLDRCTCIKSQTPVLDPYPDPRDERDEEIGMPVSEEINDHFLPPPPPNEQEMSNHQEILSYLPPAPPEENFSNGSHSSFNTFSHYANNLNPEPQIFSNPRETLSTPPWTTSFTNRDYFAPCPVDISGFTLNRHSEPITLTRREHNHPYLRVRHPGDRMLHRRPRCGLLIVKAMREDHSLPMDRRKGNRVPRTPGSIDINFHPRVGDVILRHVRLPGQATVEVWYPGFYAQDGDSLIRIKLDPFSYDSGARESSNLLIIKAKGYIRFEDMWIYMGRATHSIIKAHQRVLGVGATNGRTIYAS